MYAPGKFTGHRGRAMAPCASFGVASGIISGFADQQIAPSGGRYDAFSVTGVAKQRQHPTSPGRIHDVTRQDDASIVEANPFTALQLAE